MENIIEITNLSKTFGELKAVDNLSFRVKKGELFAFLGVNGAGKSTTINIMCGQLDKNAGTVVVCGVNIDENLNAIKSKIGVVFQFSALDKALNVYENLKIRASLYGICGESFIKRVGELDALLDLKPLYRRTVGKLSGGERRRVDIARAILHKPEILILDEPTTGLDPQTRKTVWSVVDHLRKNDGVTVFLTTHYMEEATESDYVVILDGGVIAAEGTPHDLKNKLTGDFITMYNADESRLNSLNIAYEKLSYGVRIAIPDTAAATELIIKHPELFTDYEVTKGKMDDVFLAATGKKCVGDEK